MPYLSPLAREAMPYVAGEQPRDRQYIKLNTNESAFPPSPHVCAAIEKAAGGQANGYEGLRLYPDPSCLALREAIARLHGVTPAHVFTGNGSDEVLAFAFAAFLAEGRVAAPEVSYSFYPVYAQFFHVEPVAVPMLSGFCVDVQGLLDANAPVVLANPNAPTSLALDRGTVRDMAQALHTRGQVLLVDEAYAAFSDCSVIDSVLEWDNLLVVRTLSKSHALAGLRVGYAVGHPDLIDGLMRVKDCVNSYTLDSIALCAAQAALEDTAYTAECVATVCQTRDRTANALRKLGFEVLNSSTNFLFVKKDGWAGAALFQALRTRGVLVRHFGTPLLTDWLRVSIGTEEEMETVLAILVQILNETAGENA